MKWDEEEDDAKAWTTVFKRCFKKVEDARNGDSKGDSKGEADHASVGTAEGDEKDSDDESAATNA